ncbi:MAG: O-antigen/teichoic acid export membrane protein [Saprospiraceae bacterium]|jgi:O-antigen/teichoic acid export membrane protein
MKVIKSISIYTIAGFIQKGIEFPLAIILTYYLTKAETGTMGLALIYIGLFSVLLQVGATNAVAIEFFKMPPKLFRSYFSSAMLTPVILLFVSTLVLFIFRYRLSDLMSLPSYWIPILPIGGFCLFLIQLVLMLFRSKNLTMHYAGFNIAYTILIFALSLLLVIIFTLKWEGRVVAVVLTNLTFAGVGFYFINKWKLATKQIKKVHIKDALLYGGSVIPFTLSSMVINFSDRIFIEKMVGLDEMGVYHVGYTIGSIILIVVMAFTAAFNPFLYEILSKNDERGKRKVALMSYAFLIVLGFCVIGLTIISPLFFRFLIDEKFAAGNLYVFWVAVAYFFFGAYSLFSGQVHYMKKTKALLLVAFINIVLNLLFNYYLILQFGAIGAAYATILSYIVVMIYMFIVARRSIYIPYRQVRENMAFLKEFLQENKVPFVSKWLNKK